MSEGILYTESQQKLVFDGSGYTRRGIKIFQLLYRFGAFALFLGTLYLIFVHRSVERGTEPISFGIAMILTWCGCIILLDLSERRDQSRLDGNVPTVIYENRISIPPRTIRKLTGAPDFILRDDIDHVDIIRGNGTEYLGRKNGVYWKGSPIGIVIVTKKGRKFNIGYKPPSAVLEITNIFSSQWNIRIEDNGSGMGIVMRFKDNKKLWELPYEEIQEKGLFDWE